jgi:hypothetical protein
MMEEETKVEKLWNLFEKMTDKDKLEWLQEFDIIFEIVREWDDETIDEEISRIEQKVN